MSAPKSGKFATLAGEYDFYIFKEKKRQNLLLFNYMIVVI